MRRRRMICMTELMISSLLQKSSGDRARLGRILIQVTYDSELLKNSPSETMTKYEAFRSLISQRVSKPPSAYERVRQWVCGLGGWPPQRGGGHCQINLSRSKKPEAGRATTLPRLHSAIRSPPQLGRSAASIARRDGVEG